MHTAWSQTPVGILAPSSASRPTPDGPSRASRTAIMEIAARHCGIRLIEYHHIAVGARPAEGHGVRAEERSRRSGRSQCRHVSGNAERHKPVLDQRLDVDPERGKMMHVDDGRSGNSVLADDSLEFRAGGSHRERSETPVPSIHATAGAIRSAVGFAFLSTLPAFSVAR